MRASKPNDPASTANEFPRILCAEDNEHVRRSLASLFAISKLPVVFAIDGQHALELLTARPEAFDLLITDHQMPRLDGLALVRQLRERSFPGHIIVFSSSLHAPDKAAYRALGVADLLTKPDHCFEILKLIEELHYRHHHPQADSSATSSPKPRNA